MFGIPLDSLTDELFLDGSLNEGYQGDPRYDLAVKIRTSAGEIGHREANVSEVVDAYQRMRAFSIDDRADFELRLDHITDADGWGKTKHARICVDGVFAFYVFYKGRHILTIGYSIAADKKVLIGNVQAPIETKGWGLEQLPRERLEYVIGLFQKAFFGYELYLVNGKDLIDMLAEDYRRELSSAEQWFESAESDKEKAEAGSWCSEFQRCIEDIERDRARLESAYKKTGRFKLTTTCSFNNLRHHRIEE